MRHGRPHGRRGSRRLVVVLAGALATTLTLAAALSTGAADARTQAGPTNTALPAISGSAITGQSIDASPGSWDGVTPITYAYQWVRCDSSGNNCTNIAGETSNHRLLDSSDVGHKLRVKVTATNSDGSTTATSNATAVVVSTTGPPTNTQEPVVSGTTVQGQTMTTSNGTWIGATPITYTYKWLRCDTNGSNCATISGETTANRQLTTDDIGHRLRSRVTATNSQGSTSADSNATNTITSSSGSGAPVNSALPSISGTASQGQTLTATSGSWTGQATITYAYQWQRCDANGNNCNSISGETNANRTLTSDDVGHRLRIRVTATNSQGSTSATSNATDVVATGSGGPPVNTVLPAITGSAVQGQSLVASNGTWTGAATITFTYQWLRCDSSGNACTSISNETNTNRTLTADDVGHTLRIRVTAKNGSGTSIVQSNPSAVVTAGSGGGGGGGQLPDGAVKLPSGKYSIPVTSVSLPTQLVIDKVRFSPNPVRTRTAPIIVRVHVVDTRGYVVRDALVFIRSVPLLTSTPPEAPTAQDGWVTMQMLPRATFPLKNRHFVQFFARVRKNGDTVLAGVGSRRLVQLRTARPA
jgi:large repetitive protein